MPQEIQPQELFSIKDVQIFAEGTWNGRDISSKDLDDIVEAFSATKDTVRPFLKLGHDDEQKLLQKEGLPAAGWIENVRKVGTKLIADFVDVPRKIYQVIKNKGYRKVSCEIYKNVRIHEKSFPNMLGAVALLGSELPAVLSLDDINGLYSIGGNFSSIESFAKEKKSDTIIFDGFTNKKSKEDISKMEDIEKLKFKLDEAIKKIEELSKNEDSSKAEIEKFKAEIKALQDEKAAAESKILEAQKRAKEAEVEKFVNELTADKLCTKAMQPLVRELLSDKVEKFSIGDKEGSKLDLVKEILKYSAEAGKINFDDETSNEGKEVDDIARVEKYAKEHNVDFSTAYRRLKIK